MEGHQLLNQVAGEVDHLDFRSGLQVADQRQSSVELDETVNVLCAQIQR